MTVTVTPEPAALPLSRSAIPGVFMMINSLERGGSERQFLALAHSLDQNRFRTHLGCIQQKGPFLQGLREIPEFRFGGSVYGWQSWRSRLKLVKHLRETEVAIAQAFDFYTNLSLVPAARFAGVPVTVGSHRQLGDLLTRVQAKAQAAMLAGCDRVVCNSQAAARHLAEDGVSERKIVVIRNGLAPDAFMPTTPAIPRTAGTLRVGMIARMNAAYKNHGLLLKAVSLIRTDACGFELLFVGDGPLRLVLEREAQELQIRERVRFVGDRCDIPALLASMDISVVPSRSESLSNVILESMAAGVPVLATDVGGNRELLASDRGLLVPADNPEALAAGLSQMLRNQNLRAELASTARRYAESNFSLKQMQTCYERLYTELLEEKTWYSAAQTPRSIKPAGKLKVAIVAPTLRWIGGQAVQADLLLRHWDGDPEVEIQFLPVDPLFPRWCSWIELVPVLRTFIRHPLYLAALWKGLKDVDIVHIFSASYWSFLLAPTPAWAVARLQGKRTLINYRSGEAQDHLRRSRVARMVLRHTDTLVVPSGYLEGVFKEFGLQARIVANFVDFSQFNYRERGALRPHLLCTRGFHPYYAVDVVIRAFSEVQQVYPRAQLDLVGKGPCENQIRALVQELRVANVHFLGVASRQNIGEYYDRADIFINASCLDNMPVSLLEAFASGLPVITTSPPGMGYLVEHEHTGLLSEPSDAGALAKNVIRVLRDPVLTARLVANAYEESSRYRWSTVRQQWLSIYQILARRGSTTAPGCSVARAAESSGSL
jgi:L-malate glycosyltransferase